MTRPKQAIVVAGNGPPTDDVGDVAFSLDYRDEGSGRNIRLELPPFTRRLGHIPQRTLDLLEIAAYVYGADRYSSRGRTDLVEFSSWARDFSFHIRVRDYEFWQRPAVQKKLAEALRFMTGDRSYQFFFYPGHTTPPASLFDSSRFIQPSAEPRSVTLFSGGLDSLAGAVATLEKTDDAILLVSHQSQPGTKRTQTALVKSLSSLYPGRVFHYPFGCNLRNVRAREESQRSRSFLYASVAFAVAEAFGMPRFLVFENGVTSANLARRTDLLNARASRTTHTRTLGLLEVLFSEVSGQSVSIEAPFFFLTKADVVAALRSSPAAHLISSSVSCSRTFKPLVSATHCGECFQCLDRRLATYAARAEELDHAGLYATDVVESVFTSREATTTAVDYLRQAVRLSDISADAFHDEYLDELADLTELLPGGEPELERIEKLWELFKRHGKGVLLGLERMSRLHGDLRTEPKQNSLLGVIAAREYLRPAIGRLVGSVCAVLKSAVPAMYRGGRRPKDEPDLNQKLAGLLGSHWKSLRSEHPTVSFACAQVIPDHELADQDLLIEAKYIRGSTSPSKATEGIAADLTKYPADAHILFVVMDLEGRIPNDQIFQQDIEAKGRCTVLVLR